MSAIVGKFHQGDKSYPTIELSPNQKDGTAPKFGFTFGVSKAKLILENLEAIKKFVSDNPDGKNK